MFMLIICRSVYAYDICTYVSRDSTSTTSNPFLNASTNQCCDLYGGIFLPNFLGVIWKMIPYALRPSTRLSSYCTSSFGPLSFYIVFITNTLCYCDNLGHFYCNFRNFCNFPFRIFSFNANFLFFFCRYQSSVLWALASCSYICICIYIGILPVSQLILTAIMLLVCSTATNRPPTYPPLLFSPLQHFSFDAQGFLLLLLLVLLLVFLLLLL